MVTILILYLFHVCFPSISRSNLFCKSANTGIRQNEIALIIKKLYISHACFKNSDNHLKIESLTSAI